MQFILEWLFDRRSELAGVAAIIMFAITLILRYGFGLWGPWGIAVATGLGVLAVFKGGTE